MASSGLPPNIRLGTSSFATADWVGVFYPPGTRPEEYLARYAERFRTVEIDATFYGIPSDRQVRGWDAKTPEGFVFAAKVPQSVTHEAREADDFGEIDKFLDVMRLLGPKLGPLVFQFPYISKARDPDEYVSGDRFRARLELLLAHLPDDLTFAVEIRNEKWIAPPLLDLLRARRVALTFIDYYTTPGMARIARRPETATAEFAYLRFLGNHREMDAIVERKAKEGGRRWDSIVQDRSGEMRIWVPAVRELASRARDVFVFFNNHFAGHAPGSIELFLSTWRVSAD